MYREKLSKFVGLRSDFKFRIQVNATPFNAGRLMIVYIPFSDYMSERGKWYTTNTDKAESMLTVWSGCPRVDLDVSTHTEADLVIPFSSISEYYNLITGEYSLGKLLIVVYSPLTGSPAKIDVTIWSHFLNPKLLYPTGAKSVVQIGEEQIAQETHSDIKLSDIAQSVSTVLDKTPIPKTVPWAASTAAQLLKLFGYSKPSNAEINVPMRVTQTKFMANFDGEDSGHNLGMSSKNSLANTQCDAHAIDEMSISHVASNPNYLTTFEWRDNQVNDTLLWHWRVQPVVGKVINEDKIIFQPTQLGYISQVFNLWRGGIVFRFKVVKTKFHSGRLRVCFEPQTITEEQSNPIANYSKIIDLRNETEFDYLCPYVSQSPWMYCDPDALFDQYDYFRTTGNLSVYVVNDLVAPSTVSSSVKIIVEVFGAPDFELAAPTYSSYIPYIKDVSQENKTKRVVRAVDAIVQKVDELSDVLTTPPSTWESLWPGFSKQQRDDLCVQAKSGENVNPQLKKMCQSGEEFNVGSLNIGALHTCAQTTGEKILSIAQILRRFYMYSLEKKFEDTKCTINFNTYYIKPPTGLEPASNDKDILPSLIDYFAYMYAFYRGSMRYKFFWYNHTECALIASIQTFHGRHGFPNFVENGMGTWTSTEDGANLNRRGATVVALPIENVLEVNVPYYSRNALAVVSSNPVNLADSLGVMPHSVITLSPMTEQIRKIQTSAQVHVFRSTGDDFQFSSLLGVPPLQSVLKAPSS